MPFLKKEGGGKINGRKVKIKSQFKKAELIFIGWEGSFVILSGGLFIGVRLGTEYLQA